MGNFRPLPLKCWESYLQFCGFIKNRISSSHHQWTKKGYRTIPVWGDEKEVPAQHLKTGCATLGITTAILYAWAEKNC
jgi:hypothetical protein